MHATLALVWALSAVSAEHRASKVRQGEVATPPAATVAAETIDYSYQPNPCATCRGDVGPLGRWCSACKPCNMPGVLHYYPESHGYYYFRPYNYTHVAAHQAFVQSYGGDPRNPYANDVFQGVYQQVESRHAYDEDAIHPLPPPVPSPLGPPPPVIEPAPQPPAPQPPARQPPAAAPAAPQHSATGQPSATQEPAPADAGAQVSTAPRSALRFITPVTRRKASSPAY